MKVTLVLPEHLHAILRSRADAERTTMRALVIDAIEQTYQKPRRASIKGRELTGNQRSDSKK